MLIYIYKKAILPQAIHKQLLAIRGFQHTQALKKDIGRPRAKRG